jgi:hypothetical protein
MATQARYDPGTTGTFTGTLLDTDGVAIPLANIVSCTLTMTNARTGAALNSRSAQNVLNANNVTINSTTGAITWLIQTGDTDLEDTTQDWEDHVATFTWTYETSKVGKHTHRLHCTQFMSLCTVEDVRLIFDAIPANHETLVEFLIETFTQRAELECDRRFRKSTAASPTTEYVSPHHSNLFHYRVKRFPIDSITSIKQASDADFAGSGAETLETDAYQFNADLGLVKMQWTSFMSGEKTVQIIYAGGLALETGAVPLDLRFAAARQVAFWYQRRSQPGVTEIAVSRAGRERIMSPMDLLPEVHQTLQNYKPTFI